MKKLLMHGVAAGAVFSGAQTVQSPDIQNIQQSCRYSASSVQIGQLPVNLIDEASGLAWDSDSKSFFVINDSGDSARFFNVRWTDLAPDKSANVAEVKIDNWKPFDMEDLSLGPCPSPLPGECLAFADIGDNREKRKYIEIAFVPLKALRSRQLPKKISVQKVIRLRYPERPFNAEAFAMIDRDRAVIVTKRQDRSTREAKPAVVFEVDLARSQLTQVAEFDVPSWVSNRGLGGLVTGMSIYPGSRGPAMKLMLLTYQYAVELDVSSDTEPGGRTKVEKTVWKVRARRVLDLEYLEQQEAVAYDERGRVFYTTEVPMKVFGSKFAPVRMIEKVKCPTS